MRALVTGANGFIGSALCGWIKRDTYFTSLWRTSRSLKKEYSHYGGPI